MDFWIDFWTVVLIVAVASLAGLAVVVTIGGFLDVRAMFRSMGRQRGEPGSEESDGPSGSETPQ